MSPLRLWDLDEEDLRYDVDGQLYNKASFVHVYGGTEEWSRAALPEKIPRQVPIGPGSHRGLLFLPVWWAGWL